MLFAKIRSINSAKGKTTLHPHRRGVGRTLRFSGIACLPAGREKIKNRGFLKSEPEVSESECQREALEKGERLAPVLPQGLDNFRVYAIIQV